MKICNVFPIKNQRFHKYEDYVMLYLDHLDLYNSLYFNKNQFIILNSISDHQRYFKIEDLIKRVERLSFKVNELVVPVYIHNKVEAHNFILSNIDALKSFKKYRFMLVLKINTVKDFIDIVDYLKQYGHHVAITIGVPEDAFYDIDLDEFISTFKKCVFPLHLLNLNNKIPLKSLIKVEDIIRSCDTSRIVDMIKNNSKNIDILSYTLQPGDKPIDLLKDYVDEERLEKALTVEFDNSVLKNFLGIVKD